MKNIFSRKSVSHKISFSVAAGLISLLGFGIIVFLIYSENQKIKSSKNAVHELVQSMRESIDFSMSQGISDVTPFIERMQNIKNIKELRIIPADIISTDKTEQMDRLEKLVVKSKVEEESEEQFKGVSVFRYISPIVAEKSCIGCHKGNEGDVFAVISVRYSMEETRAAISNIRLMGTLLILFLVSFVWLFITYLIKKNILNDLFKFIASIKDISNGNLETSIETTRKDEFGEMASSLEYLKQNLLQQVKTVNEFANGNFEAEVVVLSEQDVLGKSIKQIKESLNLLSEDTKKLSVAAQWGKLSERADNSKHNGIFKKIINGFNSALDYLTEPINEGSRILSKYAKGDFTERVINQYKGEHQQLQYDINNLGDSLSSLIGKISETVQSTVSAANQISSSTEEMAAGAQDQSSQAAEVADAVQQMTRTIYETTRDTSHATDVSKSAGKSAKEGGGVVEETIKGMNRIAIVVKKSAETVLELGKSSDQIGEIVQVIDDIADQTNLLALNAAIEAARAGEQGRGFAVVADEVRKLAERTTKATKEIAIMIKQIQKDTNGAVESMQQGTEEVEVGKQLAEKAGSSLRQIIQGAESVVNIVSRVAVASQEQTNAAQQINKNIENISNVTQQSVIGIQQIARASEDLNSLTLNLQELINQFQISGTSGTSKMAVRKNGKLIHM